MFRDNVSGVYDLFLETGYEDVKITVAEDRIPCAVAVMSKA